MSPTPHTQDVNIQMINNKLPILPSGYKHLIDNLSFEIQLKVKQMNNRTKSVLVDQVQIKPEKVNQ